jgi:fermentation-respiration switch protein FrsA (DUF1100 family)
MTRSMSSALWTLAIFAGLLALLWFGQRRLIYFPVRDVPPPDAVGLDNIEAVTFSTRDGLTLHGWFVPSARPASFTMIVFNGNAGNRAYRAEFAAALRARGLALFLFDYRGFGENPGAPTETGLAADARAARAYLATRPDVDLARLVYFGESLGAAVAVELATEHVPAALILRSPFTSMVDVGRTHYPLLPVGLLLRDRYPSIDRVPRLRCPLLVIAGDRDSIVPLEQSRRLYAAASPRKTLAIIEGADHNDHALFVGDRMMGAIGEFLRQIE